MATLRLAAGARAQHRTAEHIIADLRKHLSLPVVPLPRLLTPEVGPAEVSRLAGLVAAAAVA